MAIRRALRLASCLGFAALAGPSAASAHAFEIGREDVPIPIWLFIWGAAAVLVASFIALSIGWRTARLEWAQWRPLSQAVSRLLINPITEALCGAAGVGLLSVVVWSGIYGTDVAEINFSVTFVFITFWLGGVLASVLLGNVFRAFNPWRAIARLGTLALRLTLRRRVSPPLSYPERLGRWPAAAGLVAFVWMELISGAQGPGVTPRATAIAALIYTLYSLCGMALFGIEPWVTRAETFSVYFGMFAELSPFEVRISRLGIRRPPLSANLIWYIQVAALVVGHVTGLVLGHDKALVVYGGVKRAALSQRWMLLMMVTFTCLGLYLLSRANG